MDGGLLSSTFGSTGGGVNIFGGMWYLVGFFILGFFILMLLSQKVSGENITFFTLSFFLLIIASGLFPMPVGVLSPIIVLIVLYISFYAYNIFNKTD